MSTETQTPTTAEANTTEMTPTVRVKHLRKKYEALLAEQRTAVEAILTSIGVPNAIVTYPMRNEPGADVAWIQYPGCERIEIHTATFPDKQDDHLLFEAIGGSRFGNPRRILLNTETAGAERGDAWDDIITSALLV